MSSTCLSGGSTYRIDLEIVKCTSTTTTTRTSQTSSPSSTLSESSSVAISTRKPRAPRKRPNQTYNEAAALLSTAYPNIFSSSKPTKFSRPHHTTPLLDESSELLLPCRVFEYYSNSGFLLHQPACNFFLEQKMTNLMMSPSGTPTSNNTTTTTSWEVDSHENSMQICDGYRGEDDFDTESILLDEEEIGEGIDSIMGNLTVVDAPTNNNNNNNNDNHNNNISWHGNSKFNFGVRALKRVSHANWSHVPVPVVDVLQISPRLNSNSRVSDLDSELKPKTNTNSGVKKKKKKRIVELKDLKLGKDDDPTVEDLIVPKLAKGGLHLKLDYEEVLNAWSDRGNPIPEDISCANGNDVSARLAQIDLFSESGVREASVLRYKEKRRSRLFSKKIRYQVRKVNADRRPRMKGRFVRRGNSSASHSGREE